MKTLNEKFEDGDYADLKSVKGDRSWRTAILEEFDVK